MRSSKRKDRALSTLRDDVAPFVREMVSLGARKVIVDGVIVEFGPDQSVAVMPQPGTPEEAKKQAADEAERLMYGSA